MRLASLFISLAFISCTPQRVSYRPYAPNVISPPAHSYIVKKGDSLWRIAKSYDTNVKEILRANNLSSAKDLKIGQPLIIPSYSKTYGKLSFAWPLNGKVVASFGETIDHVINKGLNIKTGRVESVTAAEEGKIIYAEQLKGWGKTVIIQHGGNFYTVYANLSEILAREGEKVRKNQAIGRLSAATSGEHAVLHFEIRNGYIADNPMKYLNNS